jgi:hypothetical protein
MTKIKAKVVAAATNQMDTDQATARVIKKDGGILKW